MSLVNAFWGVFLSLSLGYKVGSANAPGIQREPKPLRPFEYLGEPNNL